MSTLFYLSKMAIVGGSAILFYGLFNLKFLLALEGIITIWLGLGVFLTLMQIENNIHEE